MHRHGAKQSCPRCSPTHRPGRSLVSSLSSARQEFIFHSCLLHFSEVSAHLFSEWDGVGGSAAWVSPTARASHQKSKSKSEYPHCSRCCVCRSKGTTLPIYRCFITSPSLFRPISRKREWPALSPIHGPPVHWARFS